MQLELQATRYPELYEKCHGAHEEACRFDRPVSELTAVAGPYRRHLSGAACPPSSRQNPKHKQEP